MSDALLIKARDHDLGDFVVRRLLPYAQRRMVGPFIFFDHMGPAQFPPGRGIDVRPHPHIGLATITYLFEGQILHRDSVGSEQTIDPGDLNWMIGGTPLAEPRYIYWNFVSSSKERLEQAKADWKNGKFAKVPGDEIEFIPLPD